MFDEKEYKVWQTYKTFNKSDDKNFVKATTANGAAKKYVKSMGEDDTDVLFVRNHDAYTKVYVSPLGDLYVTNETDRKKYKENYQLKENKMSRFNLWEKLIKEEDEFDGEVAEMGDEVEDKIEDEAGDVIFDMAVNFILALPEDSVPEDMRTEYDTLMSKIGDDYLGGADEDENAEDLEDPKFDMDEEDNLEEEEDEEMKESKDRSSYGVVLPSGTKIQVEDAAEQKRAKKAVDAYAKANPSVGDKALMKLAAMAILMKGEQIKDVIKAYDAATSEKFKEYVQKTK